jgi:NADH-quinone oxidoreductase E subunit
MSKLLSESFYETIKKLETRYPTRQALLIPALHAAQEEFGWLPAEVMAEVGECLGIHPAQVREVASFYTMFYLSPVGRNVVKVCTNVACMLRGAEDLVHLCEKKYQIRCGETTPDGRLTLLEEECIGACGTAPAAIINKEYKENLNSDLFEKILEDLK